MTNWQDKYKDLEVGQSAWYWHKTETFSGNSTWSPIRVARLWSKEYDCWNLFAYGISQNPVPISEDFPNGPKCMTPDDIDDELKFKQLETIPPWANQDSVERGCPFDEPNCFNPKND